MRVLSALSLLLLGSAAWSQAYPSQTYPVLSGYVTSVVSASDFDANGVRILCGPQTLIGAPGDMVSAGCPQTPPVIGQSIEVYGSRKKQQNAIAADWIDLKPVHRHDIEGSSIIDAGPVPAPLIAGAVEIRADGYRLLLTPHTRASFRLPLRGRQDVMTNIWVKYKAAPRPDGSFELKSATFSQNLITNQRDKMRSKTEYDPAAVPANARPNEVAVVAGLGVNPKQIPPWPNQIEQKRIDAIGHNLVPSWMANLAPDDPTRIDFRFQLTDGKRWPWILALPSGIILVPHEIVERVENDSQLAEILADSIACLLEQQTHRMRIASAATTKNAVAIWVAASQLSAAGVGSELAYQEIELLKEERQSERVSLALMHDAGFDLDEAPKAWWLLQPRSPQSLESIGMPERSAYLYRVLAEVWTPSPSHP